MARIINSLVYQKEKLCDVQKYHYLKSIIKDFIPKTIKYLGEQLQIGLENIIKLISKSNDIT